MKQPRKNSAGKGSGEKVGEPGMKQYFKTIEDED
jgi:hypothetical protein